MASNIESDGARDEKHKRQREHVKSLANVTGELQDVILPKGMIL